MNKERLMKVLLSPHVSEKTTGLALYRQYVFKILPNATKDEVAKAVELMFNVKVQAVRICNVKGKTKIVGRVKGCHQDWKKAYVTLAEGNTINLGGGA